MNHVPSTSLLEALKGLIDNDPRLCLAHLGNALSLIKVSLPPNSWVGIYRDDGKALILDAFQGTPACEEIAYGKGVVGSCFVQQATIAVKDVSTFPGYICCDAAAKSEICVPIKRQDKVIAILDIDRPDIHDFGNEKEEFEAIAELLLNWL